MPLLAIFWRGFSADAGQGGGLLAARELFASDNFHWLLGNSLSVAFTVAAIVVPLTALQTMDGRDVEFVRKGDTYQARPVTLGARDARQVAVSAGLQAGEDVVVEQSYTVKADIGKAGAGHEH